MNTSILNIKGLTKSYSRKIKVDDGHEDIERNTVLDNLDLKIERGKITALIGGNGVGKTTLFNIISGLIPSNSGEIIYYNGKETKITGKSAYHISRLGIGRLFQDAHIFPELSIIDNMLMADFCRFGEQPFTSLLFYSKVKKKDEKRIEKAFEVLNSIFEDDKSLRDRFIYHKNDPAKTLSFGQQRLLGIARLLMGNYHLILLDEPASGVNPTIIETIAKIIMKMVKDQNNAIFLIEHNMPFMARVTDVCAFLNKGKIEFLAPPQEVLKNEYVTKSYLGV
jgi:branched-chain amino acid transport system ATP-binding protein